LDWISATDDELTVTLSSSVAAADWIDPAGENGAALLQHVLLASRTSCHGQGNEYSQAGHHDYHHVLTSHEAGSIAGQKIAKQENEPLQVVVYPETSSQASLPESLSFFAIDQEDVFITAIKKAEDSEDIVVRMYNTQGTEERVNIRSYFPIEAYKQTNIIEENPQPVAPQLKVGKFGIETFGLEMK
jgi:alpha-mannosidase